MLSLMAAIVVLMSLRGVTLPRTHVAALGLQAAIAETRALAMSNSDVAGSGAMLSAVSTPRETVLSVYDSRPIQGARAPLVDSGFPPVHYPVGMTIAGKTAGQPFSILVSSSGYVSVAAGYAYDPGHPVILASDPGCDEQLGVAITIADGARSETHPLDCREARYEAVSP